MLHTLVLTLALSFQGGPTHADLHPAQADLFLELGDVSALLPALDRTPMLGFLRDERLAPLFKDLGQTPGRPLQAQVLEILTMAMPKAQPEAWFPGLKAVSASIVALGFSESTGPSVAFLALADLATPEQASALQAALVASVPAHEPLTSGFSGSVWLRLGGPPEDDLWCAAAGTRLVIGSAASKPEDYLARAEKKQGGLASSERFQKQLGALEKGSGTTVLWLALARPISEVLSTLEPGSQQSAVLAQLPADLNPLASARVARMQLAGERFVTEMVSAEAPAESGGPPVEVAWLEPVPAGSMIVYASAFDGAAAGKRMRALLAQDEQSAAALNALEQKLGFGPERVLARLGPGMTIYSAPLAGLGLPDMRAWIDCADPAAFTADFEALIGALGETQPGFQARTKPYKVKVAGSDARLEVPVTTLNLPQGMVQIPMVSLTPSYAPVGKRLVFGLNSMDVKNELKRVHSGDGEPIVAGTNPLAARGLALPAGARMVFLWDWAKLLGSALTTAKGLAGMAPPESIPFDLAKLPSAEMFEQYFKPSLQYAKGVGAGTYRRHEASFGPETWFGLFAAAFAVGIRQQGSPVPQPVGDGH